MTREIRLKPYKYGKVALVDDEDFEWLSKYNWQYQPKKHGDRVIAEIFGLGKRTKVYMHRLVTDCPTDMLVDHANHNTLDNRKSNLRICTGTQNQGNKFVRSDSSTGYKGIMWDDFRKRWLVAVKHKDYGKISGRFKSLKDAVDFYNENALEMFGEFALLNQYNPDDEREISLIDRRHSMTYKKDKGKTSRYRGVDYDIHADAGKNGKRWRAQICSNYKKIGLGRFETEREAALAYNDAARRYFGEKAKLNEVE